MRTDENVHWSLWPHGFVHPQIPDQKGMAYVLKYALKDQFNSVNSQGTMRYTKSEDNSASMFRMSKEPAIGFRYLQQKLDDWERRLIVPIKLQVAVPNYSGYWWPKATLRPYFLQRLHEINKKRRELTGKNCPQWATLLAGLSEIKNEKDMEHLYYGEEKEDAGVSEATFAAEVAAHQSAANEARKISEIRSRCGGTRVCRSCFDGKTDEQKAELAAWQRQVNTVYSDDHSTGNYTREQWFRSRDQINPHCTRKLQSDHGRAFGIGRPARRQLC
jgi:hypothetical protein